MLLPFLIDDFAIFHSELVPEFQLGWSQNLDGNPKQVRVDDKHHLLAYNANICLKEGIMLRIVLNFNIMLTFRCCWELSYLR